MTLGDAVHGVGDPVGTGLPGGDVAAILACLGKVAFVPDESATVAAPRMVRDAHGPVIDGVPCEECLHDLGFDGFAAGDVAHTSEDAPEGTSVLVGVAVAVESGHRGRLIRISWVRVSGLARSN